MQATDRIFGMFLLFQNVDVLSADFEKSHVGRIVSKVVQNRDDLRLTGWLIHESEQELRKNFLLLRLSFLAPHLSINDNRISKITRHSAGHSEAARLGVHAPLCISRKLAI